MTTAGAPSGRRSPAGGRRVLVLGVGDDGAVGLAPAVLARVRQVDLLVGGHRHLERFSDVRAERVAITTAIGDLIDRLAAVPAERRIVVLASGDPCFYGIGPLLAERLGREQVEIVPHVSSVALAFARLGLAWHDARVVSAHGRPLDEAVRAAHGAAKLAVLTDEANDPGAVARALLAAGAEDAPAWVFEHLGGEREREIAAPLSALAEQRFAPLNVLVIPRLSWHPVGERPAVSLGRPASAFVHTAGLITKPEVRAVSLSKLRLPHGGTLWDVGAGSGSLAIEAAGLAPGLTAYAVERSKEQLGVLRQNVARLADPERVRIVAGEAPEALAGLPDPDAVFVGGSGGRLLAILDAARSRIATAGRIVINLVTVENVAAVLAWAQANGVSSEVVQLSVARGAVIQGQTRLQAENPVTIVTVST